MVFTGKISDFNLRRIRRSEDKILFLNGEWSVKKLAIHHPGLNFEW